MADKEQVCCPHCHRDIGDAVKKATATDEKENTSKTSGLTIQPAWRVEDGDPIDKELEFSMIGVKYLGPNGEKMICVP